MNPGRENNLKFLWLLDFGDRGIMRTWNPVSTEFWTRRNFDFFGYSEPANSGNEFQRRNPSEPADSGVEFERRKKLRLDEARVAIKDLHPISIDAIPPCLCDPISLGIITKAVITPYGTVYDETFLRQCLSRRQIDPINRQPLTVDQIKPFPEFDELIREFSVKKTGLDAIRRECLRAADEALTSNNNDYFLDPVSRQFILFPVMSVYGSVYDLLSIQRHFQQNRGSALIDPKTEFPVVEEQYKPFPEFKIRLNHFLRRMMDQGSYPRDALSGTNYIDFITSAGNRISDENLRNFFSLCDKEELQTIFTFGNLQKFMLSQNLSIDIKILCLLILEREGLLQAIIREIWKRDRGSNVGSFFSCSASEAEKIYRDIQKVSLELNPDERLAQKLRLIGAHIDIPDDNSKPFSKLLKSIFSSEMIGLLVQKLQQIQSEAARDTAMRPK